MQKVCSLDLIVGQTSQAITKLLELTPNEACLIEFDEAGSGKEKLIEVSLVQIGDIVKINPGGRIPCDGVLFKGSSFIDESMLTGETIPISKALGSDVMAGTINLTAQILVKVNKIGADTTISRIVKLVQDAQSSKPPIQALAGRY
jgi:Cu+-exporting ATPase